MLKHLRDKLNITEDGEKEIEDLTDETSVSLDGENPNSVQAEESEELPLLPLRGVVLYPTIWLPITVG